MALPVTIEDGDFSGGLDSYSAENQIAQGFARDILNGEVVGRRVRKRRGHMGYAGNVPVRCTNVEYKNTDNQILFSLPAGVDITNVESTPIVVYGRTSSAITTGGPFTNAANAAKYYPGFTTDIRRVFLATAGLPVETVSTPASEHGINTTNMFAQVAESSSNYNLSHTLVGVDAIQINETTYNLDVDYQNSTAADKNVFIYYKDRTSSTGRAYTATLSHTGGGQETFAILAATHGLVNFTPVIRVYEDIGTERQEILFDAIVDNTGEVDITITWTGAAKTFYAILSAPDGADAITGTISAGATSSLTITAPDNPWIFASCYTVSAFNIRTHIYPNSISYSASTNEFTVSLTNSTASSISIAVYYEFGTIRSSVLKVDDATVTVDDTDDRPQITIWGLDHSEIYAASTSRQGWTTHVDSYRSATEERMICGLGGNLFEAQEYSEASDTYLLPSLYPNLLHVCSGAQTLGPVFHTSAPATAQTRGHIVTSSATTSNTVPISRVTWSSGSTVVYRLTTAGQTLSGSLSTIITNSRDYLTVTGMSNSRHEGTFLITAVTNGTTYLDVSVTNTAISDAAYDDTGCSGNGGIYTDTITLTVYPTYLSGDIVTSLEFTAASLAPIVKGVTTASSLVTVSGITAGVTMASGSVLGGTRTSDVLPLRSASTTNTQSTTNLVRGDMLSYTGIGRLLRVTYINPNADVTLSIVVASGTATATVGSGNADSLTIGKKVVIIGDNTTLAGNVTVLTAPSTTTFTFTTAVADGTYTGYYLLGETAQIDESFAWSDTTGGGKVVRVERRWIPLEMPDDSYGLTPSTYIRHFDSGTYINQAFLRSVMVAESMYLTNGEDEVQKYDGANLYRAGLIPWQPGLFVSTDITSTAQIVTGNYVVATGNITAINNDTFEVSGGREAGFTVGSRLQWTRDGVTYKLDVLDVWTNQNSSPTGFIKVRRTSGLPDTLGTANTLTFIGVRRYYFRLNAVDANQNIIASAVTGHQDHVVELPQRGSVKLRLVGMPAWDNYDYDRLECEIYATRLGSVAPYYRLSTVQMDFDNTQGYIDYTDTYSDVDLIELDQTSTLRPGAELGTAWSDPLRAKYVTSLGNKLVLGNVRDYPQLDIQFITPASSTDALFAGKILTFRRDDTVSGVTTDMAATARYEWINGTTGNTTAFTIGASSFTVTCTSISAVAGDWVYLTYSTTNQVTDTFTDANVTVANPGVITLGADHGFINGDQIQLTAGTAALPTGYSAATTYYVVARTATTIQLSLTSGGAGIQVTAVGAATGHTIAKQNDLSYSGWWQIASVSGSDMTINRTGLAAANAYPNKYVTATDPTDIPVLLGTDGNLGMVNGDSLTLFDATRRMSMAINTSMRMVDTSVSGMTTFTPWMVARSGNDVARAGRLIVRQPRVDSTTMEVLLPSSYTSGTQSFDVFVNDVRKSANAEVSATARRYPSRVLVSYDNFPELFDNPTALLDSESDSAIDINASDGQEITGTIPFFGESAFGAAQQSGILVVFKENSIYLVDLNEKDKQSRGVIGANPVQRLETEGLGCTAPYSIASTKRGIMFANESGVYCLRRDQSIQYVGKLLERNWVDTVEMDQLSIIHGHHYNLGRSYKISVPVVDATAPSLVYVYNHTAEDDRNGMGAWTRHNAHTAVGWANLGANAFWASTSGRVFILRRNGTADDFRDDSSAISFRLDARATDFGDAGIRKMIANIGVAYRVSARSVGTTVSTATDLETTYRTTTTPIIPIASTGNYLEQDIVTIQHSTDRSKGRYFQVRIANSTIDEDLEIAGLNYRVIGLNDRGLLSAQSSRSL